jgi:hypothetical protein
MLAALLVLRTAPITGLTFPEPRYVLECYPVVIAWAAAALLLRRSAAQRGRLESEGA